MTVLLANDLRLYSSPPPSSAVVEAYILNILKNYGDDLAHIDEGLMLHRVAEAFKWGFASRSELGDPFDEDITADVEQVIPDI